MSIDLPAAWAQAAGIVAAGYLLRMAALVSDGDVQVSMHMCSTVPQRPGLFIQPVQRASHTFAL